VGGAVAIPDGDTTSQDALSGAAVNVPEDLRGHAKQRNLKLLTPTLPVL
jgi:hypothetical protein